MGLLNQPIGFEVPRVRRALLTGLALAVVLVAGCTGTQESGPSSRPAMPDSGEAPMLRTVPGSGFTAQVLFTTGTSFGGYQPPGILDGAAAFPGGGATLDLFVTHELDGVAGYPYRLSNGTELTGARITRFRLDGSTRQLRTASLAYREIRV